MQVLIELVLDGLQHARVAVAYVAHANAGNQVEVALPIGAVHVHAFGPLDFEQEREVGRLGLVAQEKLAGGKHTTSNRMKQQRYAAGGGQGPRKS